MKNGKQGFIDKTGKIVIPLKYDNVEGLFDGYLEIQRNWRSGRMEVRRSGRIDMARETILPLEYHTFLNFSEGLANVGENGKWGYISKTGQTIIPFDFDVALAFSEGLAWVKKDGKWGIIKNPLLKVDKK